MTTVFLSYARADQAYAVAIAEALRDESVDTWADFQNLKLGEDWVQTITQALSQADAVIVIVSERSAQSSWVLREIRFAHGSETPIIPVVVDNFEFLPFELRDIQGVLLRSDDLAASARNAAIAIRQSLQRLARPKRLEQPFVEALAPQLAAEAKSAGETTSESAKHSVFVVHGRDSNALAEVKAYLASISVEAIVLKEMEEQEISLLHRFLRVAEQAAYAVVLLTPDDFGSSVKQYESPKGGGNALQYRARQNVILELGFFLGKLKDFDRVFVLRKDPADEWPEFDLPSDLGGAIYKALDSEGRWKVLLKRSLEKAGIQTLGA